jgi:cytidylate kinase
VGRKTLNGTPAIDAALTLSADDLEPEFALRTGDVAQAASRVAALPDVRTALVDFQRAFARRTGGAVLDGRDIGTVICPQAQVKLFVTASDAVRAERRYLELSGNGHAVTRDGVAADLQERDRRDAERATAPLIAAEDAVTLDTSSLAINAAIAQAIDLINQRRSTTG